ncbi:hypothetical protein DQ239_18675 [Blastococcus sp. TF02-09]|nr:hypothetical protein DQ239_18675 [Blastococcus sp. TF02-9]
MTWMLLAAAWTGLAAPAGWLMGRGMRLADRRDEAIRAQTSAPDFIPSDVLRSVAAQELRPN